MFRKIFRRGFEFLVINSAKVIKAIFNKLPRYLQEYIFASYDANNMMLCLRSLNKNGFFPKTIVDCGAYEGNWTKMVKGIFPDAHILMIEAQSAKEKFLIQLCSDFAPTVEYSISLLGSENKSAVEFFEMESGSSVLEELSNVPRKSVTLPMKTIDTLLAERDITGPEFLKLDLQGYEIEALKGARETMKKTEVILLEVSFISYNRNAPLFDEIIRFMKDSGFLLYDICNLKRWKGQILFQADIFFVKQNSILRKIDFVYSFS